MSVLSSRSNSWSSTTSSLNQVSSNTRFDPYNLQARATTILTSLANSPHNFSSVSQHISPSIKFEHGDDDPIYSLQSYLGRFSDISARYPGYHLDVKEACVDEMQRKVWVRSEVTGLPGGMVKERIDMLTFDDQGILVGSVDYMKIKRRV
ncbi:hypothetical protein H2198_008826 [Neophaeococcomyces mojaviensis]|uniref:Uncharacterized protein n=1 Tax=Neophaeococcomyces mojaviensis TaxID=3383035 RepID=A0ACC2ZW57_9EURO|nr:hypothetical protein H2198_008826 [Knufia sp. JES_112]